MGKRGKRSSHDLGGNWARNLYFLEIDVDANGTGGIDILAPWKLEIVDVVVECRVASGGGTITVDDGTTDITDAMICAVDKVIVKAGTIDDAKSTILKDATISATAGQAADRGLVTLVCKRLSD